MKRRFIAGLMLSLATTQVAQADNAQKLPGKDAQKTDKQNGFDMGPHNLRPVATPDHGLKA